MSHRRPSSRVWRRSAGVLVALLVGIFHICAASERSYPAILRRAAAYEELFEHCQIVYVTTSYSSQAGELVPAGQAVRCTFYVHPDGRRRRLDTIQPDSRHRDIVGHQVTDGERDIAWTHTGIDSTGMAVIRPATGLTDASFEWRVFAPLGHYRLDEMSPAIRERESGLEVAWDLPSGGKVIIEYRDDGEYLLPVRVTRCGQSPQGPRLRQTVQYSYLPSRESGSPPFLKKVAIELPAHHMTKVIEIDEVDFSPDFDDSVFRLQFPVGTRVMDEATGVTYDSELGHPEAAALFGVGPGDELIDVPRLEKQLDGVVDVMSTPEWQPKPSKTILEGSDPAEDVAKVSRGHSTRWFVLGSCIAFSIIVCLLVARKLRRLRG